ncbi:FecR domain-containing protein [Sphingomonas sp. 28-62-20]|uniref:FecR family protein n=1 Tax=Sphingomonas sp. 28-62-20 TaxID=1970433 RepID=UPI00267F0BB4
MRADQDVIVEQAIGWHVRLAEAGEDDWADFIDWMEASPENAAAYDEIAKQDRVIAGARFPEPVAAAANDNGRNHWLRGAGAIAAAAAIVALALPSLLARHASPYEVATAQGERRAITLADGTSIEISGGTRLRLDHDDMRIAVLEQGEATFHVRHDAARPFVVMAGTTKIRDLGTVFNVARQDKNLSVEVAEGSVLYQPDSEAVKLLPGDALSADETRGRVTLSKIAPALVGGWRSGRLSFSGQSLDHVAATLSRLYGTNLILAADLSARPFTGMVHFTGDAERDVPHLASLIGANWRRDGKRWILSDGAPLSR